MEWMRRVQSASLAIAVLLLLGAVPAWAGTTHGSGMVTAKSDSPQTLFVDDQVTVRVTAETQLVDPAGNPVSFDAIPVPGSASQAGHALVTYSGSENGSTVVADRIVVRILNQ